MIFISLLYHLYALIPTCDRHINYTIVCTCMFCTFTLLVAFANLKANLLRYVMLT